jgi:hypothetical protein
MKFTGSRSLTVVSAAVVAVVLAACGKKEEAAASIPLAMVEDVALVGPMAKIKDEMAKWRETCITTFLISGPPQVLETYAELVAS